MEIIVTLVDAEPSLLIDITNPTMSKAYPSATHTFRFREGKFEVLKIISQEEDRTIVDSANPVLILPTENLILEDLRTFPTLPEPGLE